jgi:WD40 repeat protein
MDLIYQQLLERNERETKPFVSIYDSYTSLLSLTDTLQAKCAAAEIEVENLRRHIQDGKGGSSSSTLNTSAMKSAMKNETKLRNKLELLQEEFNATVKKERETAVSLHEAQILNSKNEKTIITLTDQLGDERKMVNRLQQQFIETGSSSKLAEEQNDKLKEAIRSLQRENDDLKKENLIFEGRLLGEKGKAVDEMNELSDMVERLKAQVDMLRSLNEVEKKIQESKDAAKVSWFGSKGTKSTKLLDISGASSKDSEDSVETRKFGTLDMVIVPSKIKQTITAHMMDGTCVRYDHTGPNLIATASSDSTVKVWDTVSGQLRGTFRGSTGHSIICCDVASPLVVGGGSDKTCRVWNLTNERMVLFSIGMCLSTRRSTVLAHIIFPPVYRFTSWSDMKIKSLVFGYLEESKNPWSLPARPTAL